MRMNPKAKMPRPLPHHAPQPAPDLPCTEATLKLMTTAARAQVIDRPVCHGHHRGLQQRRRLRTSHEQLLLVHCHLVSVNVTMHSIATCYCMLELEKSACAVFPLGW